MFHQKPTKMKRLLLFAIACLIGGAVVAQLQPVNISKSMQNLKMPAPVKVDGSVNYTQPGNPVVNTKAVLDDIIGTSSQYDMQSNASMMSRMYLHDDGSMVGTWTGAWAAGASDRGSGYNYFDGSAWGAVTNSRIETVRTGWPNYNPWMGNGELVVSHNSTTSLVFNTRAVKGTGSWTQTTPLTVPAGITDLVWPRIITSGDNHQYIHIITVGRGSLGGQTQSLLYYRSLDGGTTWDKMGVVLPGLDGTNYLEFGGDDYAWAKPHHDTLAFVVGGGWTDTFLMYSYDNGSTWTKKIILPNYYGLVPHTTATPAFIACDGAVAVEMDKNGVFHVAFGRMRVACDGSGSTQYYPGTDGIVYWNSTQPALDTAIVTDIDSCYNNGILLGYVAANQAGDTIVDFPYYGVSLSSFPQITIDDFNNIYFFWSALTVGNPSPDPYNYRHIWGRAWYHDDAEWGEMIDLNDGVLYLFQEYVYPAVAKNMKGDNLMLLTQTSAQPGSNIKDTTIPIHDVNFEVREVQNSLFWPVGTGENSAAKNPVGKNYPNPVKDITSFNVMLDRASTVTVSVIDITGKTIMSLNKGTVAAGGHTFTVDASALSSGLYFLNVKINGNAYTQKMIVE
jgi:hypothetical protein